MNNLDITELSTAFTLCMCSGVLCSRTCPICYSPRWVDGPCVQQLWREHASSDAGKAAAQAFNDTVRTEVPFRGIKVIDGLPYVVADGQKLGIDGTLTPYITDRDADILTDAEIVERIIDFTEQLGMYLEPWQATALRAILLHGGDVEVGLPRQHS